ncbi:uncharacterized protein LOC118203786 [Stegodyphus dumicola]|uniref:uncharacterized protein LOC118203786 n=1 Tax=Stegodyphus dumicola TaxID=202533 RepID=UPI0015AF784F|nr:uncharacterized protein LOC118203786 [Stegodyphus dumicola]XP_035231959.1 uncharacterized protein LOC118203786 [Stegodyphus dumicola]
MASCEESNEDGLKPVLSSLHELIYSMGRLKFSLRSLAAIEKQLSLVSEQETDCIKDNSPLPDSNSVLEKIIHEIVSKRLSGEENTANDSACKVTAQEQHITNVEELEIVYEKLQNELRRIRQYHLNEFGKVLKESAI